MYQVSTRSSVTFSATPAASCNPDMVMSNSVILSEHPQVTKYGFLYLTTHSPTKTLLSWCTKHGFVHPIQLESMQTNMFNILISEKSNIEQFFKSICTEIPVIYHWLTLLMEMNLTIGYLFKKYNENIQRALFNAFVCSTRMNLNFS